MASRATTRLDAAIVQSAPDAARAIQLGEASEDGKAICVLATAQRGQHPREVTNGSHAHAHALSEWLPSRCSLEVLIPRRTFRARHDRHLARSRLDSRWALAPGARG